MIICKYTTKARRADKTTGRKVAQWNPCTEGHKVYKITCCCATMELFGRQH